MAIDGLERLIAEYEGGADLNRAARHVVSLAQNQLKLEGGMQADKALQQIDLVLNRIGASVLALRNISPDQVNDAYDAIVAIEKGDTSKTTREKLEKILG